MKQRRMGIDLGIQSPSVAVVLDEEGRVVVDGLRFELSLEELARVEGEALKGAPNETKLHVIMERTFPTCEYVGAFFASRGHRVSYAKPDQVKESRKVFSRKVKTDRRDAFVLAWLPSQPTWSEADRSHVTSPALRNLKTLVSQRDSMIKELVFLKNQAIRSANTVWPGLTAVFDDLDSAHARAFFRELEPEAVMELGEAALAQWLKKQGRVRWSQAQQLADRLVPLAKRVAGLRGLMKGDAGIELHRAHTVQLLDQIETLEKAIGTKNQHVEEAYQRADPEQLLMSIPGVGVATAPRLLSYFGEPGRFPTSRKAQGFVGFYPETKESGTSSQKGTALSKSGPGPLRRDLFLVTEHFRRLDPDGARVYYDQMVHKGKHHNSALCVVANRLVIPRILAVLKEKRRYELRDFEGRVIDKSRARELVAQFQVTEEVRKRLRSRVKRTEEKSRSCVSPQVTSELEAPRNGTELRPQDSINERVTLTKSQLAQLVFRSVDRLLNSGANLEEIRFALQVEEQKIFQK